MLRKYFFVFLLGIVTGQDAISGRYINDLGSEMQLLCTYSSLGQSASLSGWFVSAVGGVNGSFSLSGQATGCGNDVQLAFSVAWRNEIDNWHAVTTWSAQAIPSTISSAQAVNLYTMWLMTSESSGLNDWNGVNIGIDWFFYYEKSTSSTDG